MSNLENLLALLPCLNNKVYGVTYTINDQFRVNVAAGSVNGTSATPTGGTRSVTDTNSKISITAGTLSFATGEAANDGLWYASQTRAAGLMLLGTINNANTSDDAWFGFDNDSSGTIRNAIRFRTAAALAIVRSGTAINIGVYAATTEYACCLIAKATGAYIFIKGGLFTNWTLLYIIDADSTAVIPAVMTNLTTSIFTIANIRIPVPTFLPTPSVYDTFTRANGVMGSTETSGPDSQTTPAVAWASTLGTWAIASNKGTCSATSGGSGFATVNIGTADIIIDANLTRSAGVVGTVLRYADSSNYIIAYHDGTNAKLDKVIAGVTTNVISAAQAFSASAPIRVIASGTSFRLFYNNVAIGALGTISDAAVQSPTVHGLYTTDIGATFDNFLIMPRGTSNEYDALSKY